MVTALYTVTTISGVIALLIALRDSIAIKVNWIMALLLMLWYQPTIHPSRRFQ